MAANQIQYNSYININNGAYKVALKVIRNGDDINDYWMRIQGNTDGYPFRYNVDVGETYSNLGQLQSSVDILLENSILFNTDKIIYMEKMFYNSPSIGGNVTALPINVENMQNAFRGSGISSVVSVDAPNLRNAQNAYRNCYNLSLSALVTGAFSSNFTDASNMFADCNSIRDLPRVLNFYNCTNVNASHILANDYYLTGDIYSDLLQYGINRWRSVVDFSGAFRNCQRISANFNFNAGDNKYPFLHANNTAYMFDGCTNYNTVPYIHINSYYVHDCEGMYRDCERALHSPYILNTQVENAFPTKMAYAFQNCRSISGTCFMPLSIKDGTYGEIPGLNLVGTFANCTNLEGVAISGRATVIDSTTFQGVRQNFQIWVSNKTVFHNIVNSQIAGFNFETINNSEVGSVTLHFNNAIDHNWEPVTLGFNQHAHNDMYNIDVYCREVADIEPVRINHFSLYDEAYNYIHNASSQHYGNENNYINNITYFGLDSSHF